MKISIISLVANILILSSLAVLTFTFYPILKVYINPPKLKLSESSSSYIKIPSISAEAIIIPNVDPSNKDEYKKALEKGVAQAQGFASPGQGGTIFIFAHSSDSPWNLTRVNTAFLRLPEVRLNDPILIHQNGKDYKYLVVDRKEVWPTEVSAINVENKDMLILQTCTPIGTSLKRLLVFAKPA